MSKHLNLILLGCAGLLAVVMVVVAAATILHESSDEVVEEKNLRRIFEEHQMELPEKYTIITYDHTPTDFQGKSEKYYEIEISDEDFLSILDTQRTEQMNKNFAAMADSCDYREKNTDWCFEDGTVIDREAFYTASHIKYSRTNRFRTLYMWYAEDTGKFYILHSDG